MSSSAAILALCFLHKGVSQLTGPSYYVCEKSDGLRYLMYCTQDTNGNELHYLIDRKNDYWHVPGLHFPIPGDETAFHTSTLIDGELVLDKSGTSPSGIIAKYLVFDCLMLDSNSLMSRTLDKRIAYFKERVIDPYKELYRKYPQELEFLPFTVELKQMQVAYGIEMMFREVLPRLPHGNDGLIFTCRNSEYHPGTDPHILKWKPERENSVDFRLSLDFQLIEPDAVDRAEGITAPYYDYDALPVANLLVFKEDGRDDVWYSTMYLEDAEWEKLKKLGEPLDDRIVECFMDEKKRWRFMRWRDDKAKPNHISTVESVIESIRDGVTERELIVAAKRIRDEWKRRQADEEQKRRGGSSGASSGADLRAAVVAGAKRKADEQIGGRPSPGPGAH